TGKTEVTLPPRVHGPAPDDEAPAAVAKAFAQTFGSGAVVSNDYVEDAEEMAGYIGQAGSRYGPLTQFTVRIDAIRFPDPDIAEVRFQMVMNAGPSGFPFQGAARRRDGTWRVTRDTVARVLGTAGVTVPHRPV
ncbi:MAG: hypothetical protein JOZ99_10075, partial [Actinobacteria bacterium]|nr:hypothetical protein [Actinomycetota bacterium]